MSNLQNLRVLSSEEARRIGAIGGRQKTPAKKWAAQLRVLKKKGLTDENYKQIVAIMEEPESSALNIYSYLESIKSKCTSATQMTLLSQALIQWHRIHHGDKVKTENIHHIINWDNYFKDCVVVDSIKDISDIKIDETKE